jgi:SagB-type dehydrogenase family enzyme
MDSQLPSRRSVLVVLAVVVASLVVDLFLGAFRVVTRRDDVEWDAIAVAALPEPQRSGDLSIEGAIADRRSRRTYADDPLTRAELGQLLWAAQGVTERSSGHRAAPSAGALYPLELYVVVGEPGVSGLATGVYRYRPETHELARGSNENVQAALADAALDQRFVERAPVDIVVCGVDERTTGKYGTRGKRRYVPMEAGHAGENVYLQAEALGLSTVSIGAFRDDRILDIVGASSNQRPLYIFPVGKRQ